MAPLCRRALPMCCIGARTRCLLSTLAPALEVTTSRELDISTGWRSSGDIPEQIPLAMNDVYALQEQLPYAYFFRETLPQASLAKSLEQVLAAFPVLGGRLCLHSCAILLSEEDSVPFAIGHTEVTLDEWMQAGHGVNPKTGRPQLLKLFDPLPDQPWNSRTPLARVRVTYLADGSTCIATNISHAAADAASCLEFVHCWGRQHRNLSYPMPANNRAAVTVNGMLTAEKAGLLNLHAADSRTPGGGIVSQIFRFSAALLGPQQVTQAHEKDSAAVAHGYVVLSFSPDVLRAMKNYGERECARVLATDGGCHNEEHVVKFVSTNDMVTSAGWMLMRHLSGNQDWSMNIVVNIRGRAGTEEFGAGRGVFGNGVTAATAFLAAEPISSKVELQSVAKGARATRRALMCCYESLPDRLAASRRGAPDLSPSIGPAFCTTTWSFPWLWQLAFADHNQNDNVNQAISGTQPLLAFHGQPAHPLPPGETYAGVVVPAAGMRYQLFLPIAKMDEARRVHEQLCEAFLSTLEGRNDACCQ